MDPIFRAIVSHFLGSRAYTFGILFMGGKKSDGPVSTYVVLLLTNPPNPNPFLAPGERPVEVDMRSRCLGRRWFWLSHVIRRVRVVQSLRSAMEGAKMAAQELPWRRGGFPTRACPTGCALQIRSGTVWVSLCP